MQVQKLLTFFSKNISIYAIFNDQSFNDVLINDIDSFEQLCPDWLTVRNRYGILIYSGWQGLKVNGYTQKGEHY